MEDQKASENTFFKKLTYTDGIYPNLSLSLNTNPNRFYAVPLIGFLVKIIMLIPVFIVAIFLYLWMSLVVLLINPFIVLITGRYWQHAFDFASGVLKFYTKISFFIYGLTDKYPGFTFQTNDFTFDIPKPEHSSRLFAIPLIGWLIRIILLIPYLFFSNAVSQAAVIGVFILAWAVVLFKGRYPEGIFELARDAIRINTSASAYILGLSDRYPSFYFSMAHDKIKIILIAIALILSGWTYYNVEYQDNLSSTYKNQEIQQ